MVDSCRICANCKAGEEAYCEKGMVGTYNARDYNGELMFGGYSNNIVADARYVHSISPKLNLAAVAPLLCAGITTYSPLKFWKAGKGKKVGIVGLGGLGHMGLKFAHSMGAETVLVYDLGWQGCGWAEAGSGRGCRDEGRCGGGEACGKL